MMKIHQILNSPRGDDKHNNQATVLASLSLPGPSIMLSRPQKVAKDAPIFSEGMQTVGIVNFPPHEAGDDAELRTQHIKFHVYPMGEIAKKGIRRVPYNSEKKDFLQKTGRESFEIFQYKYTKPGEGKEFVVIWDYNVGLVKMTPFFKSFKYTKTTPAKALRENLGLADISYSITGGSLLCQGYWVPYEAAKAMAATFCYDIRWALTPVFGNDFPSSCLRPQDPSFGKFLIDSSIIQFCRKETERFRKEGEWYHIKPQALSPITPAKTHFRSPSWNMRTMKDQRQGTVDVESGYGTDTEKNDRHDYSPQVSPRSQCAGTCANECQGQDSPCTRLSFSLGSPFQEGVSYTRRAATSCPGGLPLKSLRPKRTHSKTNTPVSSIEETIDDTPSSTDINDSNNDKRPENVSREHAHLSADIDAAEMLLALSAGGNSLPPSKRTRRRSKY